MAKDMSMLQVVAICQDQWALDMCQFVVRRASFSHTVAKCNERQYSGSPYINDLQSWGTTCHESIDHGPIC